LLTSCVDSRKKIPEIQESEENSAPKTKNPEKGFCHHFVGRQHLVRTQTLTYETIQALLSENKNVIDDVNRKLHHSS